MTLRSLNGQIRRVLLGREEVAPGLSWFDRTTTLVLLGGGGISAALYLALTLVFPLPRYAAHHRLYDLVSLAGRNGWGALLYAIAAVVLFWTYWQSWRRLRTVEEEGAANARPFLVGVAAFAVLFAAVLAWMYPVNAIDLFQYFFRSRILSFYGANPFVATPARFPDDPYLYAVGEWKHIGSLYGPAWELLAAGAARLSGGALIPNLLALKGVSALFYVGSILLVYLILGRAAPRRRVSGTLLFAWNPSILLEWVGNGHNDAVMMFFVLLGVWLWTRRWHAWVLPAFVVAVLCKAIAAIVIPFFILAIWADRAGRSARLRWLTHSLILSALAAAALCAPFGFPWQNVGGILQETAGDYGFSFSAMLALIFRQWTIPSIARHVALPARTLLALKEYAYDVPGWLAVSGLAVLYVRQLVMVWQRKRDPIAAGTEAFFAVAMLVPSYRMWYPTWSMTLAALCPKRERLLRVGAACLTAGLSGLIYGYLHHWSVLIRHVLGTAFTLVLPVLLPALIRRVQRVHKPGSPGWQVPDRSGEDRPACAPPEMNKTDRTVAAACGQKEESCAPSSRCRHTGLQRGRAYRTGARRPVAGARTGRDRRRPRRLARASIPWRWPRPCPDSRQ